MPENCEAWDRPTYLRNSRRFFRYFRLGGRVSYDRWHSIWQDVWEPLWFRVWSPLAAATIESYDDDLETSHG